jgi:hypothetical protein
VMGPQKLPCTSSRVRSARYCVVARNKFCLYLPARQVSQS